MTVAELIAHLSSADPAETVYFEFDSILWPVQTVAHIPNDGQGPTPSIWVAPTPSPWLTLSREENI